MIEFGKTLRAAREAKGFTIAQVAETTHLAPSAVEDLEREDFSRIAAPIYGRGFVKLYCEAVGLEPKPMIAEFMEIFNGNHDISIKERPVQAPPEKAEPAAEPEPEPIMAEERPEPAPVLKAGELFAEPEPQPAAQPAPRLSRYAAPMSQSQEPIPATSFISPAVWRIAALACAAIVLLWLGFLGVRALYRATSATADATEDETAAETPAAEVEKTKPAAAPTAEKTPAAGKAQRSPQDVPALYID